MKFTLAVPTPLAFLIAADVCVKFISCDETPGFSLTPSADCVNANSKVAPFDCNTKANVLTIKLADKSPSPLNSPTLDTF